MKNKNLTQIALMIALLIVLGAIPGIPIGIIPVPIVLQNFGIILASLLLGGKKGTITIAIFLFLAAIGLPILSGFRGGLAVFLGPTGGYLLAWLLTPSVLAGLTQLTQRILGRPLNWFSTTAVTLVVGIVFIYLIACSWLAVQSHMPFSTALSANLLFIPGDVIKIIIAVTVAKRLRKIIPINN
ncbi:biotin transporter BioY [Nicoliella lavandulae]|uniref:Biotin transporter n=1 Tax=Nicoliella lavandulae TaxID=3082954 RepID=A0ABU8SJU8_9LACO